MMENRQSSYPNTYRMNSTATPAVQNRGPVVTAQPMQKPCKKELMDKINQYSFAVNEANLYLDNFPNDMNMLNKFNEFRKSYEGLLNDYQSKYGPIEITSPYMTTTPFAWSHDKFPWDRRNS